MGQETSAGGSGKHFYVKTKNLKPGLDDYPMLALQQKNKTSGIYEVVNEVSALTGWITSIEKVDKPKTDKYKRIRGVKFTMVDPKIGENYHFELTYSNPVRELLNRMASLESFEDELKIMFYRNKETGFCGGSLRKKSLTEETKVEIKYGYKEFIAPRIKKVVVNGETISDYEKVDHFFDELIEKKLRTLKVISATMAYTPPPVTDQQAQDEFSQETEDSTDWDNDLPF